MANAYVLIEFAKTGLSKEEGQRWMTTCLPPRCCYVQDINIDLWMFSCVGGCAVKRSLISITVGAGHLCWWATSITDSTRMMYSVSHANTALTLVLQDVSVRAWVRALVRKCVHAYICVCVFDSVCVRARAFFRQQAIKRPLHYISYSTRSIVSYKTNEPVAFCIRLQTRISYATTNLQLFFCDNDVAFTIRLLVDWLVKWLTTNL